MRTGERRNHASGTGCALGCHRVLPFVGKLANHAHAGGKGIEKRISPPGGKNRSNLLIDVLVCLREEAGKLTLRRRGEFLYSDDEADLADALLPLEREMVEKSQLFGKTLRPRIAERDE